MSSKEEEHQHWAEAHNAEARAVWEVSCAATPRAIFLQPATPDEVRPETGRILNSGICDGGRSVLHEGNNLAPGTPSANLEAMYEAARAWLP
jgi:hypothetical protein